MLTITLAQLKNDITPKLKGTSLRQINDFYGVAASAANRMLARIDTEETRRTVTLTTPFFDNIQDYFLPDDFKRMIDIRPQVEDDRKGSYSGTSPRQFNERLDPNSFSIRWNNMIRSLRAQRLPSGNVLLMDSFDDNTTNGVWSPHTDVSGIYQEQLNHVQGGASMGFNLSGSTGAGYLENTTAPVTDLSLYYYQDVSAIYFYIPSGYASRFTSFVLRRGSSSGNYKQSTVTTRADGTSFSDGWNLLLFKWNTATTVGTPDNTKNTYRYFGINYTAGAAINSCLLDNWTDALGDLFEIEYYSEYMFRSASGVWKAIPDSDTDLVNIGPASYEILKTEMMVDITQEIREGATRDAELHDWRMMLNGEPPNRYIKDPQYRGLYADYLNKFPSSAIVTQTKVYDFDV